MPRCALSRFVAASALAVSLLLPALMAAPASAESGAHRIPPPPPVDTPLDTAPRG